MDVPGLESVEVHAKDIVVRYIKVSERDRLAWQVRPIRKSIAFAIWRIPPSVTGGFTPASKPTITDDSLANQAKVKQRTKSASINSRKSALNLNDKAKGTQGDKASQVLQSKLIAAGLELVVPWIKSDEGTIARGCYDCPPGQGSMYALVFDNTFSVSMSKTIFFLLSAGPAAKASKNNILPNVPLPGPSEIEKIKEGDSPIYFTGTLLKKRRKRMQGFARRFFVLNAETSELSYYLRPTSVHLRGSIPLAMELAVVTIDSNRRAFIIDSGVEIWEIRARDMRDFEAWKHRIEKVRVKPITSARTSMEQNNMVYESTEITLKSEEHVKPNLQSVVLKLKSLKDDLHNIEKSLPENNTEQRFASMGQDIDNIIEECYSMLPRKQGLSDLFRTASLVSSIATDQWFDAQNGEDGKSETFVCADFDSEDEIPPSEYFDDRESISDEDEDEDEGRLHSPIGKNRVRMDGPTAVPSKITPYPLDELAGKIITRRNTLPNPITLNPPSLLNFIRKNIGKDLSQVAMPVTMNEPTTMLQRYAEDLEYTDLLKKAGETPSARGSRILHIAAFVVSGLSAVRHRQRVVRKSFTPLLGETYELVREDKNFRLLVEKISHRPQLFACHVDSPHFLLWSCGMPKQQFWGKSFEILSRGVINIYLPNCGEHFSYSKPTFFLKNLHVGEKYIEPSGVVTIRNDTTGEKAVITFKPVKGMFGGRSEEVDIQAFDSDGTLQPLCATGKWTESLIMHDTQGKEPHQVLWSIGDLVQRPEENCGFPLFSAQLNEITEIELNSLCATDSRLRPDQCAYEKGNADEAEVTKQLLENNQRKRRTEMEHSGVTWKPRWFYRLDHSNEEEDEEWRLIDNSDGYWEQRKKGFRESKIPVLW